MTELSRRDRAVMAVPKRPRGMPGAPFCVMKPDVGETKTAVFVASRDFFSLLFECLFRLKTMKNHNTATTRAMPRSTPRAGKTL
jgi:hypothetical protein